MASILKGQSGQPIQFETKPNVNGDDVATEQFVLDNSLGMGQTWQDVKESRVKNTTYTNTTGRPIMVCVSMMAQEASGPADLFVDGIIVSSSAASQSGVIAIRGSLSAIVPDGSTYKVEGGIDVIYWAELR